MHCQANFKASGSIMQLVTELVCEPVSLITFFFLVVQTSASAVACVAAQECSPRAKNTTIGGGGQTLLGLGCLESEK